MIAMCALIMAVLWLAGVIAVLKCPRRRQTAEFEQWKAKEGFR